MVATDMQCIVNDIGRIVIPAKLRKKFDINEESTVEIYVQDGTIRMQKMKPACILCNTSESLHKFKGKTLCKACLDDLINC